MSFQTALDLIHQAQANSSSTLDLSGQSLSIVNLIRLLPKIGQLSNLTRLSLYQNQLTEVPKQLGQLSKLTELSLSNNQLSEVPKELGQLSNLTRLSLSRNQLTEVPKQLGQLSNLTRLSLYYNQLTEVPKELGQLSNLTRLYLYHNQLSEVPKQLGQLSNLTELSLDHNYLTKVPQELGQLSNLTALSLSHNQLTEVPKQLGQLSNLTELSLSRNQLTEVPKQLGQLSNLIRLSLYHNQLTEVPQELGQLSNLIRLSLSHNQLTEVPQELGQLSNLIRLSLSHNPHLTVPPPEVLEQGTEAILTYLQSQREGIRQWLSKLLVVGEGGVGKTSLLRALRGEEFQEQQSSTHGIEIAALPLIHPTEADVTMTLNTWDFGGQEIYHATHQFFLTNRSLFLLAWNARAGYEQGKLIYWLKTIRANAPNSPVILVATWIDERDADLPLSDLRQEFPQIVGAYSVSNKTGVGMVILKDAITQTAADLPLMGESWPEPWLKVANATRQAHRKYVTPRQFSAVMDKYQVSKKAKPVLAQYLHELGDILFFKDNPELNDLVILKPQWVTAYISRVLTAEDVIKNYGIFTRRCMEKLWGNLPPGLQDHFLELMEQFDLSYKIPDDPEDRSLVVERLDHEPAQYRDRWHTIQQTPNCKEISMKFQLSEILAGIPTWFIARQHRFTLTLHWRTGVLFGDDRHHPKHLGLLRVERDTLTNADFVRLTVRGPVPQNFFAVLRSGLELTLERYPGLQVTRLVPCLDPTQQQCLHEFDYKNLERRLTINKPTIECPNCDQDIAIGELLYGLTATTQTQVLAKLERIDRNTQEQLDELQELRALVQRQFLQEFKREQKFLESYCPNLFVLQPDNRQRWHQDIGSHRVNLQLYCQCPGEVHPTCNPHQRPTQKDPAQGFYPINTPAQWLQTMSPYVSRMVRVLKYAAPLVSPVLGKGAEALAEQVESDVELMDALVEKLPDITDADGFGFPETDVRRLRFDDPDDIDYERLTGSGLRALREFLKQEDPKEQWGGLRRVLTPEGDYLWLCDNHAKVYYPK